MPAADIAKLASNGAIATAFFVAAILGKIEWLLALGAMAMLLTPSALPTIVDMVRTLGAKGGAS